MSRWREDRGQATVELVALVPLVAGTVLLTGGYLAAQRVREAADGAAVAAAVAHLQGRDVEGAAQAAAPDWARMRVRVHSGVVRVTVRWRGPRALAGLVDAERAVAFAPGAAR